MRNFSDLTEKEILALAISQRGGGRPHLRRFRRRPARGLSRTPRNVFTEMAAEEGDHRRQLIELFRQKFGEHIPLIRRQDVRGFVHAPPALADRARSASTRSASMAQSMELETQRFYRQAAARTSDASIRKLLGDLAEAESEHEHTADRLVEENLPASVRAARRTRRSGDVRPARDPAGARRADGRLGLDARAGVRRRLRHRAVRGTPSWSASPPRSARASRWASPRRSPTTAA